VSGQLLAAAGTKDGTFLPAMPRNLQGPVPVEAVSSARLDSLETVAVQLASPLPLQRIVAVVGQAAIDLLDAEIVALAVHVDDRRHCRGVHIAGVPHDGHERLSAAPCDEASLVAEIDELLDSHGASLAIGSLAVLRIRQVVCPPGLMVFGRLEPRPFSELERTFASVLAGLCGLALDRLRLCAERARDHRRQHAAETERTHVRVGDMDIDLVDHHVAIDGRVASLTASEMRLLTFLAEQPGHARSRREILQHLWHTEHVGDERACDVHISNLRRKIERVPSKPARLITMRGYGYALVPR
jgi:DNA-binding winged helix-turn-helix (wHTH) protein